MTTYQQTENDANISFEVSDSMKSAGLKELILESSTFIFSFTDKSKCCISFSINKDSLPDIVKKTRNQLKSKLVSEFADLAFRDFETQLIDRRMEIFPVNEHKDNFSISTVTEEQRRVIDRIIKLRMELKESQISSEDWRLKLIEKYDMLRVIIQQQLPELWLPLEFIISARMILKIKDWTLPFMAVILAVPSSLKTVALDLTIDYPYTFTTDEFTPNSFVSHYSGMSEAELQKIDMLPQMANQICIFPELAPLFTAKDEDLSKNFGKIIRLLDGNGFRSNSGAQGQRGYPGKNMFVVLGAAVEVPYRIYKLFGNLGQKIYYFRLPRIEKSREARKEAAKHKNHIQNKISQIKEVLFDYLIWLDSAPQSVAEMDRNGLLKFPWDVKKEDEEEQENAIGYIVDIGNILSHLRGVVNTYESNSRTYNTNSRKPPEEKSDKNSDANPALEFENDFSIIEESQRAIIHLKSLAMGHALSLGRNYLTKDDIPIVIKTALSSATIGRVRIFDFLLEKKGEVSSSEICKNLKVSVHTAHRIMTELDALEIVDISAVGSYRNSELRIKLKEEFAWFLSTEFYSLREGFRPVDYTKLKYRSNGSSEQDAVEGRDKNDMCDSHTHEELLPPQMETNNFGEHYANDNSSSKQNNTIDDRPFELTSHDNHTPNFDIPMRGEEKYTHVTPSHGHMETNSPSGKDNENRQQLLRLILHAIKEVDTIVSPVDIIRSLCNKNEIVKTYVGDERTQRENRRVRELCVDVVHDRNIEVIKTRPQILVKWRTGDVH